MVPLLRRAAAAILACALGATVTAGAAGAETVPSIVVTPTYWPTPIHKAGSTVSIITAEDIARTSAASLVEALRAVPGVTVVEAGGPGGQAHVQIRGAEPGHTLVLIDGIRVNDPASARDEFDFTTLAVTDIERIEILKGPQSALYGSDAIGGVINIITRRPPGAMRASATAEGGAYGARRAGLSAGGTAGAFSFSASGSYFANDGFSRVGDRDAGEPDGTEKYGATLRGTIDGGDNLAFAFGFDGHHQASDIDASATVDAAGYTSVRDLVSGFARLSLSGPDGGAEHTLTAFATQTTRFFGEPTRDTSYRASDIGAEHQSHLQLGTMGSLTVGTRFEQVTAFQERTDKPAPSFDARELLYAGYLLHQLPVDARLNLSLAARHDGEVGGLGFTTGRFTAVYDLAETETRIRASLGTGAKRPTAFQRSYNADLMAERSVGADLGVERTLFDGRLTVSATGFWNRFHDLIDWDPTAPAPPDGFFPGNYVNITEARTAGVEVAAEASIVPGVLTGAAAYTYLTARDLATGLPLPRRPAHAAKLRLTYTGVQNLAATLSATLVGARFNDAAATVRLPPYARVDLDARYRASEALTLFARVENLFNATYQEVSGYNTAGRSAYAGLTWRR